MTLGRLPNGRLLCKAWRLAHCADFAIEKCVFFRLEQTIVGSQPSAAPITLQKECEMRVNKC